jgi:hypothetical protein
MVNDELRNQNEESMTNAEVPGLRNLNRADEIIGVNDGLGICRNGFPLSRD